MIIILPIYTKWVENPTITSPVSTNYPIWNIDFPAITICSNNKVVEGQMKKVLRTEHWMNLMKEKYENFKDPEDEIEDDLIQAISSTVLFESQSYLLNELYNSSIEILNHHYNHLPQAIQQV